MTTEPPVFRLLGAPGVDGPEGIRAPAGARQALLLALLAVDPGTSVADDRLCEALWPRARPQRPAGALQSQVSRLRRLTGAGRIVRAPRGYLLDATRDEVDATALEDAVTQARRLVAAGAYVSARVLATRALDLWRGEPMTGLPDETGLRQAAARLADLHVEASSVVAEAQVALGLHEQAVTPLRALVAQHPLREDLWALLMTALYRCGRTGDALAAYRAARQGLLRELGLEPGERLRHLERDVLAGADALAAPVHPCAAHAPLLAGPGSTAPAATDRQLATAFVERARLGAPDAMADQVDHADVRRLCGWLDGDPVAVELAAVSLGPLGLSGVPALLRRHRPAAVRRG